MAVAGVGKEMSTASMGVMPWIIEIVADQVNLQDGMFCNFIPCTGILILSLVMVKIKILRKWCQYNKYDNEEPIGGTRGEIRVIMERNSKKAAVTTAALLEYSLLFSHLNEHIVLVPLR